MRVPPCIVAGQNDNLSTPIASQSFAVCIASDIVCDSLTRIGFTKIYALDLRLYPLLSLKFCIILTASLKSLKVKPLLILFNLV